MNHRQRYEKVYFFGTCLVDALYPQAGLAAIRLLQHHGVQVIFPSGQTCCGQPAYNSGFFKEARAVARHQIRCFPKNYPIIVPSGSCAAMMKHHYLELFAGDPEIEAVGHFVDRVFELSQFLVGVLDARLEDRGAPVKVTWHSSCHALREMKIIEDSKSLIRQLKNVDLVELARESECCGFGGTFAVKQPQISAAMVSDKVDDIQGTGATWVISGDCGCLMNIAGAMEKRNLPLAGVHLAQFLWERINETAGAV